MKLSITIICFLITTGYSQAQSMDKKTLKQLLKPKDEFYTKDWHICNNDSVYYKADTLYLLEFNTTCKSNILWRFENPERFTVAKVQHLSNGMSSINASTSDDQYKLKIIDNDNQLYFKILQNKREVFRFRVIEAGYDKKEKRNSIKLVKVKL